MLFDPKLVELLVVEGAECWGQPAERPEQPALRGDDVLDEPEPHLPDEGEASLGLAQNLDEWIASLEKIAVQIAAAVGRIGKIAAPVRAFESAAKEIARDPEVSGPRHDVCAENQIGRSLEAAYSALLDQFITELSEAKAGSVVAELQAGHHSELYISNARPVAVAPLEPKIDGPADREGKQVHIREEGGRQQLCQNIHRR
ncbi:hypothetical protein [Bradyrhizobium sp. LA6.10]|uniref:hypothetical protein n=1 Tax=Bradyrhizobium sp. LA6.10 TaxID=3156318 RepID=UPI003399E6D8